MRNENFSLDTSGLSEWVDETQNALIRKSLLEGRTLNTLTLMPNVKHKATINIIDPQANLRTGDACGFTAAGDTPFTQREMEVCPIVDQQSFCINDLNEFYLSKSMSPGSYGDSDQPIGQIFLEGLAQTTNIDVNQVIWQGDTTITGSTDVNRICDGFLKLMDDSQGYISAGTGVLSAATIIDQVDAVVQAIPLDLLNDEVTLYIGYDKFNIYMQALLNDNRFHFKPEAVDYTYKIDGRQNITLMADRGLNGLDEIFGSVKVNLFFGTDILSDFSGVKFRYSEDNEEWRYTMRAKMGVQVAFPELVVRHRAS